MNRAIARAHELIDKIPLIPGYTGDEGEIVITIVQRNNNARSVSISFNTVYKKDLGCGELRRVERRKVI
jgi:hypothetical protein